MDQIKQCEFEKINTCQGKNSGGHVGTIHSIPNGYCAKLDGPGSREFDFYKDHNEKGFKPLDKFITEFDGYCVDKKLKNKYVVIKNVKDKFEKAWEMDIKIGLRSANRYELRDRMGVLTRGLKKYYHNLLDNYFSITGTYGFRVENFSRDKKYQYLNSKNMQPGHVFRIYFQYDTTGKILKNFIKKIEDFYDIIMEDGFEPYFMIGSSLLFVYDKNNAANGNYNVDIIMIDFNHSSIVDISNFTPRNKHFLYVNEYRYGVLTIIKELKHYFIDINPNKSLFTRKPQNSQKVSKKKKDKDYIINGIKMHNKKFTVKKRF
uniref:Kinase n=1 Tax=viral metagenome TaxID=1070528 RepID=A0A6C0E5T4_9ZZZZ